MKNFVRASLYLAFLFSTASLAQDLYRCDLPDGRVVYQDSQCQIGTDQRALDPENARRERIEKAEEQAREARRQKSTTKTTAR